MTVHQLKIGDIECAVLQEGAASMDRASVAARYPNASPAEVEAATWRGRTVGQPQPAIP